VRRGGSPVTATPIYHLPWALITPGNRHLYEEGEVSTAQTLRIEIIWVVTVSTRTESLRQGNRWLEELHCGTLHELCSSPNFIREIKPRRRWAGYVARMGGWMSAYWVLLGRPEGMKPLGRPNRRWENNIRIHLK
jgi:hypothetical protein